MGSSPSNLFGSTGANLKHSDVTIGVAYHERIADLNINYSVFFIELYFAYFGDHNERRIIVFVIFYLSSHLFLRAHVLILFPFLKLLFVVNQNQIIL